MTEFDFPEATRAKPLWLVTLADLALLLVGFLVLLQASNLDRRQLAQAMRDGFGQADEAAMPVEATSVAFAPGSATIGDAADLIAWARQAARDPRVALTITGATDGTPADVDAATGSAAVLAADRARAVAAALAPSVQAGRLSILTTVKPGARAALVTLAFAGEQPKAQP